MKWKLKVSRDMQLYHKTVFWSLSYFTVKVVIYTDGSVCVFYGQTIRVGIKYTFALFSTKRLDYLSLKRGGIFWGFKLIA